MQQQSCNTVKLNSFELCLTSSYNPLTYTELAVWNPSNISAALPCASSYISVGLLHTLPAGKTPRRQPLTALRHVWVSS